MNYKYGILYGYENPTPISCMYSKIFPPWWHIYIPIHKTLNFPSLSFSLSLHPLRPYLYKLNQQQQTMIRAEKADGVIILATLLPTVFMFPLLQPLMCSDAALTR